MIKKSIPTALALLCLTSTVALAEGGLPIIDMHMHAKDVMRGPDGKAMPVPCQPQPCERRPAAADTADRVFELTLQAMKRHNIVKAFLSDYPQTMVYKWVEAAPDRFIPSAGVVKPGDPTPQFLRAEHKAGRLRGIGEIGAQYSGIPPNDASLEPYFALAEELDLPVLIHTLGIGAPHRSFRSAAGNPLLLEDVLVRHPKLRLYVENAGYPYLGEAIAIMSQYPQLYADVSTITWIIPREAFHDYLRALVRAGLGKRLMFGSDQMQWPETIELAVEGIESADFLNREQKRDIFYNNAARFLRLDKQPSE